MLTQSDIDRALNLFGERKQARDVRAKLDRGPVRLMVGTGADACEVVLAKEYLAEIVGEVRVSLDQQIAHIDKTLTEMGIEP